MHTDGRAHRYCGQDKLSAAPMHSVTAPPTPLPAGPARTAIVLHGGVWPLRGTKGCPSQNTEAADVLHRIPTASASIGAARRS